MSLLITVVKTGEVLDEVTLTDGVASYRTGQAQDMFESPRARNSALTDTQLYELLAGSTNGYLQVEEAGPETIITAADREYVRDNDGQFAKVPGWGDLGSFDRLDFFDAGALETKFGRPIDTATVGDEIEGESQRMRIRIFADGTSQLSNDLVAPSGEERFQPFTTPLSSEELRELASALDTAIDLDPDDYDEDDDDADGIIDWTDAAGIEFGRYRNGDIRLIRTEPIDPDEPDRNPMYLYDLGEDEQQDLLRELNLAADRQEDLELRLEDDGTEDDDDLSDASYIETEGMGEVAAIPRPDDGQVELRFTDSPKSDIALDVPEIQAIGNALATAQDGFGRSQPDNEVPFFSDSLTFGPYSGMNIEAFNANGTLVFQMRGTGVLDRIGEIHLEGDDPAEFQNILDEAVALVPAGPVTAGALHRPGLNCCRGQDGLPVHKGPCRGKKPDVPKAAPSTAKLKAKAKKRPPARKPARPRLDELSARTAHLGSLGAPDASAQVGGGQVAEAVELRTYPDGTRAVFKRASDNEAMGWSMTAKQQADAEELGSLVGASLGLKVPAVHREDEGSVLMDFMDGDVAAGVSPGEGYSRFLDIPVETRSRIGLFDALIDNVDRHKGNFLFTPDNDPALIDHGLAWQFDQGDGKPANEAPTLREFGNTVVSAGEYVDNLFTKNDMDQARTRLEALRPEFERLGRGDWLDSSLTRLDAIAGHARGKKDLIA